MPLPRAILFDLDDTLISAYGNPGEAWRDVVEEFSDELHPLRDELVATILAVGTTYWSDPIRSAAARLAINDARRAIVTEAFRELGLSRRQVGPDNLVERLVSRFAQHRDERMYLFEGTLPVLDAARAAGVALGLVTNGATEAQRTKLHRFDLAGRFGHVQIEEEAGYGKPDPRAFTQTLNALGVSPGDAWMVGDNFEADIVTPSRMGMTTWWIDRDGTGRSGMEVTPSHTLPDLNGLLRELVP